MKVKVHWVIDGIAELEAESIEKAEKIINQKLSDFVSGNSDLEQELGAKAIQGKGYLLWFRRLVLKYYRSPSLKPFERRMVFGIILDFVSKKVIQKVGFINRSFVG